MALFYFAFFNLIEKFFCFKFVEEFFNKLYNKCMELKDIKGFGKSRLEKLNNAGIETVLDLLKFFPKKYYDFSNCDEFSNDGRYHMLKVKMLSKPKLVKRSKQMTFVLAQAQDEKSGHKFNLIWFNQPYIVNSLSSLCELYVYGKVSPTKKENFVVSMHKKVDDNIDCNHLFSVYKTFEGIGQALIKNAITEILNKENITSLLDGEVERKEGLISLKQAYFDIHFPKNLQDVANAVERISFEDALVFVHINKMSRVYQKQKRVFFYGKFDDDLKMYQVLLPYKLTESQKSAINQINQDLSGEFTCNRLIQGDTGSGKTVVALWPMFLCTKRNLQSVLMAPTEILANQHYNFAKNIFKDCGFNIALLTSSTKTEDKKKIMNDIMSGKTHMVFGTQSVLGEQIQYNNLQFIISDEQHRFGVAERAKLSAKGNCVDMLTMSATPIPRSVNLVLFGGLDITRMTGRPKPFNTQTNIVTSVKENDMWQFIKSELNNGRACYVVCAKIDDEEEKDLVVSTTLMTNKLKQIFGEEIVAELNGRMKEQEKLEILNKFKNNQIKVLVSTTVIEVGVDNPNAGIIVISNPERFGLATLHQLRGRVGRDGTKSYCFCLVNNNINKTAIERLLFFKNNENGFDIADFDLKMRGAGDVYGFRQHGQYSDAGFSINLSVYDKAKRVDSKLVDNKEFIERIDKIAKIKYRSFARNIVMN